MPRNPSSPESSSSPPAGGRGSLAEYLLRAGIRRSLEALDAACAEMNGLEDDLADFLEEYYARVGEQAEQLSALGEEDALIDETPATVDKPYERELRGLYRSLAKAFHPDMRRDTGEEKPDAMMQEINQAYRERALGRLWHTRYLQETNEIQSLPRRLRMERLAALHARIASAVTLVNARLERLAASPEHALWERVCAARLRGHDLIEEISGHLQQEIARTERRKAYLALRSRLMAEA